MAKKKNKAADRKQSERRRAKSAAPKSQSGGAPRCGLCGATKNLTKTECCSQWICDDEHKYQLFSFARNSCHRNHRRFTLCGFHHAEEHPGRWQDCPKCRDQIETEMYVYYGTNEYNFEVLQNPPEYEPTLLYRLRQKDHSLGRRLYDVSRRDFLPALYQRQTS
jgi:hypothetical protein